MMNFVVTLLQGFPARVPRAVQARFRFADGHVQSWPVTVRPGAGREVVALTSDRDMQVKEAVARSLVAHYETPPLQEERQIARIQPG